MPPHITPGSHWGGFRVLLVGGGSTGLTAAETKDSFLRNCGLETPHHLLRTSPRCITEKCLVVFFAHNHPQKTPEAGTVLSRAGKGKQRESRTELRPLLLPTTAAPEDVEQTTAAPLCTFAVVGTSRGSGKEAGWEERR